MTYLDRFFSGQKSQYLNFQKKNKYGIIYKNTYTVVSLKRVDRYTGEQDEFPYLIVGDNDVEETEYTDSINDVDISSELNDPDLDSKRENSIPRQRGVPTAIGGGKSTGKNTKAG